MENSFILKTANIVVDDPDDVFSVPLPQSYTARQCPRCGVVLFGEERECMTCPPLSD
jgi:hypothetical protein